MTGQTDRAVAKEIPMPKITSISHVVLYVRDLDKMVDFYTNMLGLIKYRENPGRMVFLTPDPELDDHQLALVKGREGDAKLIAHIAWKVETPAEIKEFYERFKTAGVPIDGVGLQMHISAAGDAATRVGFTMQQAMGVAASGWGVGSNRVTSPYSEVLV